MITENTLSFEKRIETYKRIEKAFAKFSSVSNFCINACISQKKSLYNISPQPLFKKAIPGNVACCRYDQNAFVFSIEKNEHIEKKFIKLQKINKKYEKMKKACPYHNKEKGCMIEELKPPVCLTFFCEQQLEKIKKTYNIDYNPLKENYQIEEFLFGTVEKKYMNNLADKLKEATKRIQNHKEGTSHKLLEI